MYVVCGDREHIDTLHFSLRYLKHFSAFDIIVVTDASRNKIPIEHDQVIDIKVPEWMNHLQASRYLKTGLHKFLPAGAIYCYLDTDVIPLSKECDTVFNYRKGVINFAPDLGRMGAFGVAAVNCDCRKINQSERAELQQLIEKYEANKSITDPKLIEKQKALLQKLNKLKADKKSNFWKIFRLLTAINSFKLDEDTFYRVNDMSWYDSDGNTIWISGKATRKKIETNSLWRWRKKAG